MFNFKDVARVIQGVQLLASKSKVVPVKISKKTQQDQSIVQMTTILKLFSHEVMRVFGDRITDINGITCIKLYIFENKAIKSFDFLLNRREFAQKYAEDLYNQ